LLLIIFASTDACTTIRHLLAHMGCINNYLQCDGLIPINKMLSHSVLYLSFIDRSVNRLSAVTLWPTKITLKSGALVGKSKLLSRNNSRQSQALHLAQPPTFKHMSLHKCSAPCHARRLHCHLGGYGATAMIVKLMLP
jgi:hypothetical protein